MARLTDEKREDIINQFHLGISQYQLAKDFECSPATVNKLVKGLTPKLKEKVNEAVAIKSALVGESERLVNAFDTKVNDICRFKGIITNLTELNLSKLSKHLESNKKLEKINIGDGVQKFEEVGLGTSDYKNAQDTIDKASITLEVAPRHSQSQVQVNNQNNNGVVPGEPEQITITVKK